MGTCNNQNEIFCYINKHTHAIWEEYLYTQKNKSIDISEFLSLAS